MKRSIASLAAICLLVGAMVPTALGADPTRRFEKVDVSTTDPSFRPYLADPDRTVTVVLQMDGRPVISAAALTGRSERQSAAKRLRAEQGRLDARIKRLGGRVLDRYQYAYNGIKVRTTNAKLADLAALPGVVAVRRLPMYELDNVRAMPYVGAPTAWQATGVTGVGQTIAVIDSGIDYTHANFGGPGTPEAYDDNDPTFVEPDSFPTAKVIAGHDFAGDDFDASGDEGSATPAPDDDPLDCGDHGSHVSGIAAGQGVLADHSTYPGPYNASTLADPTDFVIGPGVAPRAKLVALKIFGCLGVTDLVIDALEWVAAYNVAHADDIDIVNMSLGAPFGDSQNPDAVAVNNLVDMGVIVVASAGNASAVPFISDTPASATKAISVAAVDALPTVPLATVDLPSDPDIAGTNQNASPNLPVNGTLHVVPDGGGVSLGCTADDYDAASDGAIVAVKRGDCPFVEKGAAAQEAGAIGVIMINRDDTAPDEQQPYVFYSPELFTIPMVAVTKTAQPTLLANEGAAISLESAGSIANPTYKHVADFSSSGPRFGDNWLKPDVAAPGVSIVSSLNGSGWDGTTHDGTSMAAPMTAGTAALVLDAHPSWSPLAVKAAIANTASTTSSKLLGYDPLRAGAGVIQARRAVNTVGLATTSQGTASISFGYEQAEGAFSETKSIRIWNTSRRAITYRLSASGSNVTIFPSLIRVPARSSRLVRVTIALSERRVSRLPSADQFVSGQFGELTSLAGVVTARPRSDRAGVYPLRVPYLLVPRGLSELTATLAAPLAPDGSGTMNLRNRGIHTGFADVYALSMSDQQRDGAAGTDLRAVGVQSIPASVLTGEDDPDDRSILFAVNSWDRFSSEAPHEIDIAVDTDDDGEPDVYVVGIDNGLFSTGIYDGLYVSLIIDATTFDVLDGWLADAPPNGSTILLPALASDLGLTAAAGSFTYWVAAFDGFTGLADETVTSPSFDVFDPAQSSGDFEQVAAKTRTSIPVWIDPTAPTVEGWMVVTLDDRNGTYQADLVTASGP